MYILYIIRLFIAKFPHKSIHPSTYTRVPCSHCELAWCIDFGCLDSGEEEAPSSGCLSCAGLRSKSTEPIAATVSTALMIPPEMASARCSTAASRSSFEGFFLALGVSSAGVSMLHRAALR